jgi:hypothetical protein
MKAGDILQGAATYSGLVYQQPHAPSLADTLCMSSSRYDSRCSAAPACTDIRLRNPLLATTTLFDRVALEITAFDTLKVATQSPLQWSRIGNSHPLS